MSNHEIVEIFDSHGNVTGTMTRGEAEHANHLTQNVLMFIFNTRGEVWFQLRPMTKKHYPGLWDISACGGVVTGEELITSARRELQEETGLVCELQYVESFMNVFPGDHGETRRRLSHLYIGVTDDIPRVNEEVDEFRALPVARLRAEVEADPHKFVPPFLLELDKAVAAHNQTAV